MTSQSLVADRGGGDPSSGRPAWGPVLTETKLHIPAARADLVERRTLVERLVTGADRKLTLVDAPAGSGKTSLLIAWHAAVQEQRPFAWISLDPADNDPVRFWDCVIAALRTVDPTIGAEAQTALHSPGTTVVDHMLPLLINELAARAQRLVFVLDDYHVIESAAIHGELELLIERLPATVNLVLATRSDPPLPLGRLRATGDMIEIRAADLRFSPGEAASLLNHTLDLELDAADVARLQQRTEGWVTGLQLAGLSLRGREDRRGFVESFAGDDRQIVDYLGFEVLDQQPEPIRDFLLKTSILNRLSGGLCEAVTDDSDAAGLLEALDRANLFVVALDSRREWYRYHQLFSDLLRHELAKARPELVASLHRRAAAWYRAEGAIHEAIEHAIAAGDFAEAIELITMHWYEFLQRGRLGTVAGWIDALPPRAVTDEPNLCLTKAWIGVNMGRLDEVDRWIAVAGRLVDSATPDLGVAPLASGVASLRAIHRYMDGDVRRAVEAGRHALELERGGPASPWRPVGCPVLGLALHWCGDNESSLETLSDAVRIAKANGNHLAAMHASGGLAAIHFERGDIDDATDAACQALALAEERGLVEHWASALSLTIWGRVLERNGQLEPAYEAISRAVELAERGVASIEIAYALMGLAEARHREGRREDASALRQRARRALHDCADPGILGQLLAKMERRLQLAPRGTQSVASASDGLSDTELSVLRLLPSQLSQREIGAEMYVSINTVKTHTRSIYRKLGVATRDEAVERARHLRLL